MNKNERIFGLDLMRCIAILLVLISHSRFFIPILPQDQQAITVMGFLGVEVFFVLSGFLIGGILIKTFEQEATGESLKTFWVRRWLRTLPNYYLFILINIAIVIFIAPQGITFKGLGYYFFFLQNFSWPKAAFFNVSWSLCVEEWFYLLYPVLVLILRYFLKMSIKRSFLIATFLFILIPIAFRFLCIGHRHWGFAKTRMIVISRLDAMMTGVFVAYLKFYHRKVYDKLTMPFMVAGAVITIGLFTYYITNDIEQSGVFVKVFFLTALTIGFALFLPICAKLKTSKSNFIIGGIYKISLWSYSLYLINFPINYLIFFVRDKYALTGDGYSYLFLVVFFTASISLASLLYKYVEKPFLVLRDKYFKENKREPLVKAPKVVVNQ